MECTCLVPEITFKEAVKQNGYKPE